MVGTRIVPVTLPDGRSLHIEASDLSESSPELEKAVSGYSSLLFDGALTSIESLAKEMAGLLQRVGPTKASIEFSVELGVEAGQLTALLVKGSGKAKPEVRSQLGKHKSTHKF